MKKIITVFVLVGLIAVNSCERFVDEPKNATAVTPIDIFRNTNDINYFFNGIYWTFLLGGPSPGFAGEGGDTQNYSSLLNANNAYGHDVVRFRREWFIFHHTREVFADNTRVAHFHWHFPYFVIEQVNTILAELDASPHLSAEASAPHYAEAYALRAHMHHLLATVYARPYGHPNRSESPAPPISTSVADVTAGGFPLSTVPEIYAQIVADFERSLDSYEMVPNHERVSKTRIDEAVAKALYARVLLDMGDYSAAAPMFEGAIEDHTGESASNYTPDNGEYSVVPLASGLPSVSPWDRRFHRHRHSFMDVGTCQFSGRKRFLSGL